MKLNVYIAILISAWLTMYAAICHSEENRYMVMWTAGVETATMEEVAELEEAMQILFGEGKAWIILMQVLPETGEEDMQQIPDERDI